ncbi:helix-turn-helix transcriptional regulator [Intrasporangium mesophilum]
MIGTRRASQARAASAPLKSVVDPGVSTDARQTARPSAVSATRPGAVWTRDMPSAKLVLAGRAAEPCRRRIRDGILPIQPPHEPAFLGRIAERSVLDGVLNTVRGGLGSVLVVRGEAGVGKSRLLRYCIEQAADFQVVVATGVQSEMELPFAALQQLCAPLLDGLPALPPPQRAALEVALGLTKGETPSRFLVALGGLSLLSEAGASRPLLCVIDDAQWLDRASQEAFGFMARRLLGESVAVVFGMRTPASDGNLRGLPVMYLEGLDDADARELLGSVILGRLDRGARDRLLAEAHGNPLALLELPRRLSPSQLPGAVGPPAAGELAESIEDAFVERLRRLPSNAQMLALVAAAEPGDDVLLVWRAARRLSLDPEAASVIDAEGLFTLDEHVRFRHPLVRSAAYRSASADDRRRAHLALADSLDRTEDADRHAWHLAAGTVGPDEQVANELEASADRAQARGGMAAAAAFLRRSTALTEDPAKRAARAISAARASLQAGEFDIALEILPPAESFNDQHLQVHADHVRGLVLLASGEAGLAATMLLGAARQLDRFDPRLAREAYLDAWSGAFFADGFAETTMLDVAQAATTSSPRSAEPDGVELFLTGISGLMIHGRAAAAPTLRRAVQALLNEPQGADSEMRWMVIAAIASMEIWDFEGWVAIVKTRTQAARDTGALGALAIALTGMGLVLSWSGDLAGADRATTEAQMISDATGTQVSQAGRMLLAAFRGNSESMISIKSQGADAVAARRGASVHIGHWAMAILCNSLSLYDQAVDAAQKAWEMWPDLFVSVWSMIELAEAAVRTSQPGLAQLAVQRVIASTDVSDTGWALGIAARSRALIAEGVQAEALYREAIEHLGATNLRPELARGHLLYGEWLRRQGRRGDARAQLRVAHAMFSDMGAEAFAERSRLELLAAGAGPEKRAERRTDELTVQEIHIARLAADGHTNAQIGSELYLSRHTIEWHLRKVFDKLGIGSRWELRGALADRGLE